MKSDTQKPTFIHDVFISYSRKDKEFAKKLEKALEDYRPPKNLKVPQRNLDVFRDEEDFTGVEYHQSLEKHLKESAKLIVLCSPNSRKSDYVNDEIKLFADANGADNIIPVLVSGTPNNEAKPGQEDEKAFPDALCKAMEMPLAADYRNFDPQKHRLTKDIFSACWYKLLADIYGIGRGEIEQREKKRQLRRRNITIGLVSAIVAVLAAALVVTLISRQEAIKQKNIAIARQLEAEARESVLNAEANLPKDPQLSLLLAIHSVSKTWSRDKTVIPESESLLRRTIMATTKKLTGHSVGIERLAWSPDGKQLATAGHDKLVIIWDPFTLNRTKTLDGHQDWVMDVSWSPDGRRLATGGWDEQVIIWDAESGERIRVKKLEEDVQSVDWNKDSVRLAAGTIGGTVVLDSELNEMFNLPGFRAAWSPDGSRLATGDVNGVVRIFDRTGRELFPPMTGHNRYVHDIAWSPDGKRTATASVDDTVRIWDAVDGKGLKVLEKAFALSVCWSPDGRFVAGGSGDSFAQIWDSSSYQSLPKLESPETLIGTRTSFGPGEYVTGMEWSPDGKYLAIADRGGFSGTPAVLIYNMSLLDATTIDDLLTVARSQVTRDFTAQECERYLHAATCPSEP